MRYTTRLKFSPMPVVGKTFFANFGIKLLSHVVGQAVATSSASAFFLELDVGTHTYTLDLLDPAVLLS